MSREKTPNETTTTTNLESNEVPSLKDNLIAMATTLAFNKTTDDIQNAIQSVPKGILQLAIARV